VALNEKAEKGSLPGRLLLKAVRPFWRMRRGLTLGAQGAVLDAEGRVLLARHTYRPGWCFPGGGVEWGETLEQALTRELAEEVSVDLTGPAVLHGVFANSDAFPGDHIAVYVVRAWERSNPVRQSREIAAVEFFDPEALPETTDPGTRRRLAEILDGAPLTPNW
jgi:ADP-ribose pyrophosphatase YjhB (NUDIX family)